MRLDVQGRYWLLRIIGKVYKFFLLYVFCSTISLAITVEEITRSLRERYEGAKTFIISYRQHTQVKGLKRVDKFDCRAVFSRPDRFRWEGTDAEGRRQIVVGQDMAVYSRYIPWLNFSNDMRTKYVDTEMEGEKKIYKLEILPESGDEYKNMFLWVDADRQDIIKAEVIDTAENHSTLFFDSVVFTNEVPEREFVLE